MRRSASGLVVLLGVALLGTACPDGRITLRPVTTQAWVSPEQLTWSTTPAGQDVTKTVHLWATGPGQVAATLNVEPAGMPFTLSHAQVVVNGSGQDVDVTFLSGEPGAFVATLVIRSQDGAGSMLHVGLQADVEAPPDCWDDNPCTQDTRVQGVCTHVPVMQACDDGNTCTSQDHCADGLCTGTPVVCNDAVACTRDACQPGVGCVFTPDDMACQDDDPCTADVCHLQTGCSSVVVPNGTACGQSDCQLLSLCVGGTCSRFPTPEGTACNDADPCTEADSCQGGMCVSGEGAPLGMGRPVAISIRAYDGRGWPLMRPVGVQPLGASRARVVWSEGAYPLGNDECGLRACDTPDAYGFCGSNASGYWNRLWMVTTRADGTTQSPVELPMPGQDVVAGFAAAAMAGPDLVVLAHTVELPACVGGNDSDELVAAILASRAHITAWIIRQDGTVVGPRVFEEALRAERIEVSSADLAVAGAPGEVALVWQAPGSGVGPEHVRALVVTTDGSFAVMNTGSMHTASSLLDTEALHGMTAALMGDTLHAAWRRRTRAALPGCTQAAVVEVLEHQAANRGRLLVFVPVPPDVPARFMRVAMSASAGAPLLLSARADTEPGVCMCDTGNCRLSWSTSAALGVETVDWPYDIQASAYPSFTATTRAGLPVGVVSAQDRVAVFSPALAGRTPWATFTDLGAVGLSSGPVVASAAQDNPMWVGLHVSEPSTRTAGVVLVPVGCGRSGSQQGLADLFAPPEP